MVALSDAARDGLILRNVAALARPPRTVEPTRRALTAAEARRFLESARADFERVILRGETIVPPSDAFGPCFTRRPASLTPKGGGAPVAGYEWLRVDSIPDARCRVW